MDFSKMTKAERLAWYKEKQQEREAKETPEQRARWLEASRQIAKRPAIALEPEDGPELAAEAPQSTKTPKTK